MEDTTEVMRQQIAETRSQLTGRLVSLEQQVSDTVQSTGTAVNATVGAVQETVESVTSAIQSAVQSVTDAIDLRQQIKQHPWLVLGGSVALGYLAVNFLEQSAKASGVKQESATPLRPAHENRQPAAPQIPISHAATSSATNAASEAASTNFLWHPLTSAITVALVGIVQDAATHVVPEMIQYLNRSTATTEKAATAVQNGNRQRSTLPTIERFAACRTNAG